MITALHTDIGIRKKVNQDSMIVMQASAEGTGKVLMAAVCDGMGGLHDGELASKETVMSLKKWFEGELPQLLEKGLTTRRFEESLNRMILEVDERMNLYSFEKGDCGTTLAGIVMADGKFGCVNIGDSRVYRIRSGKLAQLTHDQSVVQKEIDEGQLTEEEAAGHPQRNVLLQCIGAGCEVTAEYSYGLYKEGDVFIVCSDGFRHKLTKEEIADMFDGRKLHTEEELKEAAVRAVEENKARKEKDNISVIVVRIEE